MGRKWMNKGLGAFHRDATARGLTYAEAQIQETCRLIGRVRAPKGDSLEAPLYQKVSARNFLRKIEKGM